MNAEGLSLTREEHLISNGIIRVHGSLVDIFSVRYPDSSYSFCALNAVPGSPGEIISRRAPGSSMFEYKYLAERAGIIAFERAFAYLIASDFTVRGKAVFIRRFHGFGTAELRLTALIGVTRRIVYDYDIAGEKCDCVIMTAPDGGQMLLALCGDIRFNAEDMLISVLAGKSALIFSAGRIDTAVKNACAALSGIERLAYKAGAADPRISAMRLCSPDDCLSRRAVRFIEDAALLILGAVGGSGAADFRESDGVIASEQYFCIRALLAAGLHAEAKRILYYFAARFASTGEIENVSGEKVYFSGSGAPAFIILAAGDYLRLSGDKSAFDRLAPMLRHAAEIQISSSRGGLCRSTGGEKAFRYGWAPPEMVYAASARSTMLFIRSLEVCAELFPADAAKYKSAALRARSAFESAFVRGNQLYSFSRCAAFDRRSRFRAGYCEVCGGGMYPSRPDILERLADGRYVCVKCYGSAGTAVKTEPPASDYDIALSFDRVLALYTGFKYEGDDCGPLNSIAAYALRECCLPIHAGTRREDNAALGMLLCVLAREGDDRAERLAEGCLEKLGHGLLFNDGTFSLPYETLPLYVNAIFMEGMLSLLRRRYPLS